MNSNTHKRTLRSLSFLVLPHVAFVVHSYLCVCVCVCMGECVYGCFQLLYPFRSTFLFVFLFFSSTLRAFLLRSLGAVLC